LCPGALGCTLPSWFLACCAFNTFIYQTMDNLDGKQARLTKTSSALGELFDHGCDSLFLLMMSVCVANAMGLTAWQAFILLTTGSIVFFSTHWEEYYTNHLILGRFANPTEVQCLLMVILLGSSFYGPWLFHVPFSTVLPFLPSFLGSINVARIFEYGTIIGCVLQLIENSVKVNRIASKHNGSFLHCCFPMLPVVLHTVFMVLWVYKSTFNIVENQTGCMLIYIGVMYSVLCDQLVVCRITKMEYNPFNPVLILSFIGMANVTFFRSPIIPEYIVLPMALVILVTVYVFFLVSVALQLSHYLNITIFTIPDPEAVTFQPKVASMQ